MTATTHPGQAIDPGGTPAQQLVERRDALLEAHAAWREAEDACHSQSAKHFFASWANAPTPHMVDVEPLTEEALNRLSRLRDAAAAAQQRYEDLLGPG